jgi:glycosyltransferase involved in cell wall biosynthesis
MTVPTGKLKVLHLTLNLDIGGGQQVVRTLVEYLAGDTCTPVVCAFKDGPLRQEIEQLGIKVELVPPRRYSVIAFPWFVADMVRILRSLTQIVKQYDIDAIQTHLLSTLAFLTLCLRWTTRVRAIFWTFHSANFVLTANQLPRFRWLLGPKRYVHKLIYRLAVRWVSGYIAVSEQVKDSLVQVIGPIQDKIAVICNGVDLKRYSRPVDKPLVRRQLGLDAQAFLIIMVGTLREPKGHCYMIEAMSELVPRHPNMHALFVGDGELREELQAQVARLGLVEHIHFLGNRSDVPDLLAASDLFALPSLWEGLSMALLEAMASGLPIMASAVSGTVQAITAGETGLLFPAGDVPAFVAAIEQVLSNPARAQQMGLAARQRVEAEFSADQQAKAHIALYRQALGAD